MFSLLMQAAVVALGIAKVELGGKVLYVLMLMEVGILLLVDATIVTQPIIFDISAFTRPPCFMTM
ncbi:MAG: hypothetical protein ACR5LD_07945 [Symbiopectobacterium sp.]